MTTLAMIFGMLPTAIALSKGSEMRQPDGGRGDRRPAALLFLSLLMVPTFYEIIDSFGDWFAIVKKSAITGLKM